MSTEFAPFKSLFLNFSVNYKHGHQFFKHYYKDEFSISVFDSREGNFSNYEFNDYSQVVICLTHTVPGLVNSEICNTMQTEESRHCSCDRKFQVLLKIVLSFMIGCCRGNVYFGMLHAFTVMRRIEYFQGFLWILLSILFKELIENLGIPSIASVSRITNVRMLIIGIWMILRILETVQYGNFWNFKLNDVSLLRDFLMQYNVSGFLCPFYACFNALEPKFVLCSKFIFLFHCWEIATYLLLFSFHVDHLYIFHAKFLSTGRRRRFESYNNTYVVFYSLCFILDVNISGLLDMNRHPLLHSFNVVIVKVLSKSDENKYGNHISNNSQEFAYRMINDSSTVDLITLSNSVEFTQKFQAPYFQICAINISKNSKM